MFYIQPAQNWSLLKSSIIQKFVSINLKAVAYKFDQTKFIWQGQMKNDAATEEYNQKNKG